MMILEVKKPIQRNKAHLKALLYSKLYDAGFDVYIDLVSNSLVHYTSGVKGYQKIQFDLVVFVDDKPKIVVLVDASSRRYTKASIMGVPIVKLKSSEYFQDVYRGILKMF
jgi:hypothetical protein